MWRTRLFLALILFGYWAKLSFVWKEDNRPWWNIHANRETSSFVRATVNLFPDPVRIKGKSNLVINGSSVNNVNKKIWPKKFLSANHSRHRLKVPSDKRDEFWVRVGVLEKHDDGVTFQVPLALFDELFPDFIDYISGAGCYNTRRDSYGTRRRIANIGERNKYVGFHSSLTERDRSSQLGFHGQPWSLYQAEMSSCLKCVSFHLPDLLPQRAQRP